MYSKARDDSFNMNAGSSMGKKRTVIILSREEGYAETWSSKQSIYIYYYK